MPAEELYDLSADPAEMNNLADDPQFAAVRQRMSTRVDAMIVETADEGIQSEIDLIQRYSNMEKSKNN